MHEYSIVQALLDRVEAEVTKRQATQVHSLTVQIGELSGVDAGLLATAFETFREKTICANSSMHIERVAAVWRCPRCQAAPAAGGPLRCLPCNRPAQLVAGDEIVLAHLELEVPTHV